MFHLNTRDASKLGIFSLIIDIGLVPKAPVILSAKVLQNSSTIVAFLPGEDVDPITVTYNIGFSAFMILELHP